MDSETLMKNYLFGLGCIFFLLVVFSALPGDRCCHRLLEHPGYWVLFISSLCATFITGILLIFKQKHMDQGVLLIIGILVVIPVMLYFGTFPCCPVSSESCNMPAGMTCTKYHLSSETDLIEISIVNGLQKTIVVTDMSCSKSNAQFEDINDVIMKLGEPHEFIANCNDEGGKSMTFDEGESFSGRINIQYYFVDEGPDNLRKIQGNIYVRAG